MTVSPSATPLQDRVKTLRSSIPPDVRLIGVSKKVSSTAMRAAYQAGIRDFGESRLQEALPKQAELQDLDGVIWHLIGHLQTNKARKAVAHFDWIHSVDSLKLAYRLNDLAAELNKSPLCCLQVKMVPDPAKYGFSVEEVWEVLPQLNRMAHLRIVGIMTIPPLESSLADCEQIFGQARALGAKINDQALAHIQITELSMGMSGDYAAAIAAGSTMVRLGSILFGDRTP